MRQFRMRRLLLQAALPIAVLLLSALLVWAAVNYQMTRVPTWTATGTFATYNPAEPRTSKVLAEARTMLGPQVSLPSDQPLVIVRVNWTSRGAFTGPGDPRFQLLTSVPSGWNLLRSSDPDTIVGFDSASTDALTKPPFTTRSDVATDHTIPTVRAARALQITAVYVPGPKADTTPDSSDTPEAWLMFARGDRALRVDSVPLRGEAD